MPKMSPMLIFKLNLVFSILNLLFYRFTGSDFNLIVALVCFVSAIIMYLEYGGGRYDK